MTKWQDDSVERYSPTARRRRLGLGLRSLRMSRGMNAEQAAKGLGISTSLLTKTETAERNVNRPALLGMLSFYKADDKETGELLELHATSRERGWFQEYGVQPGSFVDWESEASKVQGFEDSFIPGLLQTEAYAEAVIAATRPELPEAKRDAWAKARAERAALLDETDGPELHYIIHEHALRLPVGGPEVMADQLTRVVSLCQRMKNLTVQVLPVSFGAHAGMEGAFTILTFAELPSLVAVEHVLSTAWYEKPTQINTFATAFGRIATQALPAPESLKLIRTVAKEWRT
jgi:transcriptional regulator with XRE-family HTH domain